MQCRHRRRNRPRATKPFTRIGARSCQVAGRSHGKTRHDPAPVRGRARLRLLSQRQPGGRRRGQRGDYGRHLRRGQRGWVLRGRHARWRMRRDRVGLRTDAAAHRRPVPQHHRCSVCGRGRPGFELPHDVDPQGARFILHLAQRICPSRRMWRSAQVVPSVPEGAYQAASRATDRCRCRCVRRCVPRSASARG